MKIVVYVIALISGVYAVIHILAVLTRGGGHSSIETSKPSIQIVEDLRNANDVPKEEQIRSRVRSIVEADYKERRVGRAIVFHPPNAESIAIGDFELIDGVVFWFANELYHIATIDGGSASITSVESSSEATIKIVEVLTRLIHRGGGTNWLIR